jgi:rhodanese-related sulfurtransferase
MKTPTQLTTLAGIVLSMSFASAQAPQNPQVDMPGFLRDATAAAAQRSTMDQQRFMEMAAEKGTVILDARSADKFAMLHVKGAVNLPFTDFTAESLAKILPDKSTRILIYCNNNFNNAPVSMALKYAPASLNLSTLVSLRTYGYTNVHELAGYIDVKKSKLPFAGTDVP